MKPVIAKFIHDKQEDHHAHGNADGKTQYIDERKHFTLHQVTPGNFEIIFKHCNRVDGSWLIVHG